MKVVVECEIWFQIDVDGMELSNAMSGPLYGDKATFRDILYESEDGCQVGTVIISGTYEENDQLRSDTNDDLEEDIAELVGDLLSQNGFPVEETDVKILEYL